jgi:hypothetical protein
VKRLPPRKGPLSAFVLALLPAAAAAALSLGVPGCGLQGEGQRCDRNTQATHDGSDDCAPPLVCKSKGELMGNSDICCPVGPSTNPACIPGGGVGGGASTTDAATTAATTAGAGGAGGATSATTATAASTGTGTSTSTGM